jgi:hypothetical protein
VAITIILSPGGCPMADKKIAMQIVFDGQDHSQYKHIKGFITGGKDESGWTHSLYEEDTPFYKLEFNSQTDLDNLRSDKASPMYGYEARWSEEFTLMHAERAVKALRKIDQYMRKAHDQAGPCGTFGAWVLRLCKAAKIDRMLIHREGEWCGVSLEYGMMLIDAKVQSWADYANGKVNA